jgi:hypothetical protein
MGSQGPQSAASTNSLQRHETRAPVIQALIVVAEQELLGALGEQSPLAFGAPAHPSPGETAALNRAVRAVCHEAHRLDLRAEEMVIAVKQAWSQVSAMRASRLGERDGDVLKQVVSSSIELFFEERDGDERRAQLSIPEDQRE